MLNQKYTTEKLTGMLIPREQYKAHPTIEDRAAWTGVPETVARAHVSAAEKLIGYDYPSLPATLFLQYSRDGNRSNYEAAHFARRRALETLVVAECLEAKGRFLDDIVNGIWTICEETYWGVPAHIWPQKAGNTLPDAAEPTIDLFAAETGNLMAWSSYLLGDKLDAVSPLVRERMALEIERRILDPLFERDDFHWMGFQLHENERRVNNWNPWICSNWLATALLMEPDEDRRVQTVSKILRALDNFIDPYPEDGGCDEGPAYWGRAGASLFDNLDLLSHASNGQIDVYNDPKIREIGRFIYRVHIGGDYYINFADAPAIVSPDAAVVYRYGEAIHDPKMMQHGRWLAARQSLLDRGYAAKASNMPTNLQRLLRGLFAIREISTAPSAPLPRDTWLPDINVLVARDHEGSTDGFFLGAKGGHNNESHNHNDVGNLVVYLDAKPLIVDAGVETYSAKTFGPDRYSIWTMRSSYHTLLPTVDGVEQAPGFAYCASDVDYRSDDDAVRFSLDIASAYPPEAGIASWRREVALERHEHVTVTDEYELSADRAELVVSFLTPCAVDIAEEGVVKLSARETATGLESASGRVAYDAEVFGVSVETLETDDERLSQFWGDRLFRVVLTAVRPAKTGQLVYTITK